MISFEEMLKEREEKFRAHFEAEVAAWEELQRYHTKRMKEESNETLFSGRR